MVPLGDGDEIGQGVYIRQRCQGFGYVLVLKSIDGFRRVCFVMLYNLHMFLIFFWFLQISYNLYLRKNSFLAPIWYSRALLHFMTNYISCLSHPLSWSCALWSNKLSKHTFSVCTVALFPQTLSFSLFLIPSLSPLKCYLSFLLQLGTDTFLKPEIIEMATYSELPGYFAHIFFF